MITLRELTKRYGETVAVDGLTLDVKGGLVTGFLGPNGAGKSTTMRMILGLDRPTGGEALIDGRPYASMRHPVREVGALLDAKALHPARSARGHLVAQARSNGIPLRRVDEVLETVGLAKVARRPAGAFSSACTSGWAWRAHCSATRGYSSSTSRSTASTPTVSAGCASSSGPWPRRAGRSSCPAT